MPGCVYVVHVATTCCAAHQVQHLLHFAAHRTARTSRTGHKVTCSTTAAARAVVVSSTTAPRKTACSCCAYPTVSTQGGPHHTRGASGCWLAALTQQGGGAHKPGVAASCWAVAASAHSPLVGGAGSDVHVHDPGQATT
jgi:hypothetical protein